MFFTCCLFHLHSFFDIILLVLIIFHSEPNVHSLSLSLHQWVGVVYCCSVVGGLSMGDCVGVVSSVIASMFLSTSLLMILCAANMCFR